jgi:hypothetical protein
MDDIGKGYRTAHAAGILSGPAVSFEPAVATTPDDRKVDGPCRRRSTNAAGSERHRTASAAISESK